MPRNGIHLADITDLNKLCDQSKDQICRHLAMRGTSGFPTGCFRYVCQEAELKQILNSVMVEGLTRNTKWS